MEIAKTQDGSVSVVAVTGSLDALTAPQLTTAFEAELTGGRARLVADLSGLEYSSSAGLRVLLSAAKEARTRGGDLRLAGAQEHVQKVLEMSGFTSILKIYPDVSGAVASFGA